MTQIIFFVGVDIASASFMACVGTTPWKLTVKPEKFENIEDGFASFLNWLKNNKHPLAYAPCKQCHTQPHQGSIHLDSDSTLWMNSTAASNT